MNGSFNFRNLDAAGRNYMIEEIDLANKNGEHYFSTRFTNIGTQRWVEFLAAAARNFDPSWLATQLRDCGAIKGSETKHKPTGGSTTAQVPLTAEQTLPDGQFNRFYIASVCRRAIESGKDSVRVYRAKPVGEPRLESRVLEGTLQNASDLLCEVRSKEESLRCDLLKPNSGLTVEV